MCVCVRILGMLHYRYSYVFWKAVGIIFGFESHVVCLCARPSVHLYVINHVSHPCSTYRWLSIFYNAILVAYHTLYIKYKLFTKYKSQRGRCSASYDKLYISLWRYGVQHNTCSKMQIFFFIRLSAWCNYIYDIMDSRSHRANKIIVKRYCRFSITNCSTMWCLD